METGSTEGQCNYRPLTSTLHWLATDHADQREVYYTPLSRVNTGGKDHKWVTMDQLQSAEINKITF